MPWTERQRQLLQAMGVAPWLPASAVVEDLAVLDDVAPAPSDEPVAEVAALPRVAPATTSTPKPTTTPATTPTPTPATARAPAALVSPAAAPLRGLRPEVATLDWNGLREAVAQCTACKLCERRRQTVFGVGDTAAHWMVVGEAPGEQEDREGEPFVGKAGQLLDQMLAAIGLTRGAGEPSRQVYIANTLKCRPPGNRNPEPDELAQCEPFLLRQIELLRPRVVLAMGRFAVQSLLRSSEPIGRLRGRVHEYHGVPLIVTYHPAYLLRQPADKARAWDDLCLAREVGLQQARRAAEA